MDMMPWRFVSLCAALVLATNAEEKLRMCLQDVTESQRSSLDREGSPVKCHQVVDSTNCAIDLAEGKADFGVFTADELLLAHHFYPTGVQVVAQLRNKDSMDDEFQFQSVVVVPKSYTPSEGGFGALVGSGFCHPGFSESQMWNDHILKYFEKKVLNNVCQQKMTVIENEVNNLRDFFKKGCRPGEWVSDQELDKVLKKKYPQLCELCDDPENCSYLRGEKHGHMGALDCLTSGRGQVAYASLRYVKEYFSDYRCVELDSEISVIYKNSEPNQGEKKISDYQYLCEDRTVMPLYTTTPCTWFKQPWKVILAREDKAALLLEKLKQVRESKYALSWEQTLSAILFKDDSFILYENYTSSMHYLSKAREVELPRSECGSEIRWCTVSQMETNKCNWTSAAALISGIKPAITCVAAQSPFECFDKISKNEADIITIDSNYGHLARKVYGLSPILFAETKSSRYSFVVAVVRKSGRIRSLAELKDANACFPEYGGIAWLSFINVAREHGVLLDSCKYPEIVAKLLHGACTPGFVEANHSQKNMKPRLAADNMSKLCDLCPAQSNGERCEANYLNDYYGDKGALDCVRAGTGDIAFLEIRNLQEYVKNGSINASEYRVLCKNGSLAEYTGFDVDDTCALSVTIDSEIVSRRDSKDPQLKDTTLALLEVENWLGFRVNDERRSILVYSPFNYTKDLLFKDSTSGLVSTNSNIKGVLAYKELFRHVDTCSGVAPIIAVVALVLANFLAARLA